MSSSWTPILPPVVAASAPRVALTVATAAQTILDTHVASLTELHVLGRDVADADDRVRLHPPADVPNLVSDIGTLDLLVLDERLATAELVETLEAARGHGDGDQDPPPVVVYQGGEDIDWADLQILPKAALAVVDAWERAVVPGQDGLVVLVDPARLATHPRLGHLLRHLQTPAYLTQRVFAVDLRRKAAEQRANGAVEAEPSSRDRAPGGARAAVAKAEATATGATERAQLATRSADDLRLALSAAQERLLELVSETQEALRESAALRARLSEVRQSTASLEARLAAEEGEKRQLGENLGALRSRERQLLENIRELEDVIVESNQAEARRERLVQYLEALASSTTWRWGHRIAVFLRRLTFRRPVGPSALDRALDLAKEPVVRGTGRRDVEG